MYAMSGMIGEMKDLYNTNKYCEGCCVRHLQGEDCDFIKNNTNGSCPCTICVVKTMCQDWCESFVEWTDDVMIKEGSAPMVKTYKEEEK